ncbi:MAG: zinc-ribbon domain-containing protein [Acidimicrobiia bacterium]
MTRCPECGARIREEAVTCSACGADLGAPLTVLELDDPEIGIRPEDRFAAIPPGPRIVPRRVHDDSTYAPLMLLGALVAFFLVGAWLGSPSSSPPQTGTATGPAPALDQSTGATLVLLGGDGAIELDVDEGTATRAAEGLGAIADAVTARGRLVPATAEGRVWLVTREPDGSSLAQEIDADDGSPTSAPIQVDGFVSGAVTSGLVVERTSGALEVVERDGRVTLSLPEGRLFLAATGSLLATRVSGCFPSECDVLVDNVETGTSRRLRVDLGPGGTEVAGFSPDGHQLVVARSDGVQTRGVVVDVGLETVTTFRARAVRRDSGAPLAWSPDGAWLFIATERDGLDAVGTDGQEYRVATEVTPFEAILSV